MVVRLVIYSVLFDFHSLSIKRVIIPGIGNHKLFKGNFWAWFAIGWRSFILVIFVSVATLLLKNMR